MSEIDTSFENETRKHQQAVCTLMSLVSEHLIRRGLMHDKSKLSEFEYEGFAKETPNLKSLTFGSPEYNEALVRLQKYLTHHYANNRHHPQYFFTEANDKHAIDKMNLFDIVEMICDWIASSRRQQDGDVLRSLEVNAEKFGISKQLYQILLNTIISIQDMETNSPTCK